MLQLIGSICVAVALYASDVVVDAIDDMVEDEG